VWIVWGLGSTTLVLCAALMSGLVALSRKASAEANHISPA